MSNLLSIPEASKISKMQYATLWIRVIKSGLKPLANAKKAGLYDETELLRIANLPKHKTGPRPPRKKHNTKLSVDACTRCGKTDTGNSVRGGLCLDCWCHDYCLEHHL